MSTIDELKRLQSLLNEGAISHDEFEMLKKNIISSDNVEKSIEENKSNEIQDNEDDLPSATKNSVLKKVTCSNCGAELLIEPNAQLASCNYCNSQFEINQTDYSDDYNDKIYYLDDKELNKYNKVLKLITEAIAARNFRESLKYTNELLEMNPESSHLWMYKAFSTFHIAVKVGNVPNKATEIVSYLNSAAKFKPVASNLIETRKSIGKSIFEVCISAINTLGKYTLTYEIVQDIYDYITLMEVAYDLNNNIIYLKTAVDELSLKKAKVHWNYDEEIKTAFPTQNLREKYIKRIKSVEPNYLPPKIYKGTTLKIIRFFLNLD